MEDKQLKEFLLNCLESYPAEERAKLTPENALHFEFEGGYTYSITYGDLLKIQEENNTPEQNDENEA